MLADGHKMMREALRHFLDKDKGICVVADVGSRSEIADKADETAPDILLVEADSADMDAIEVTQGLTGRRSGIKVIGLSAQPDKYKVLAMLEAGAAGILIKSEAGEELFRAIRTVMTGQIYLCPLALGLIAGTSKGSRKDGKSRLAPREREVLRLLAQGMNSPAIGMRMSISPSTVEVHRRNITRKVGLRGIAELTKYAIREGFVTA